MLTPCGAPSRSELFDSLDSDGCSYIGVNEFLCAIDDLRRGAARARQAELGPDNKGLIYNIRLILVRAGEVRLPLPWPRQVNRFIVLRDSRGT